MKWYTFAELAEKYEVEKHLVKNWRQLNKFPNAVKDGNKWLIPESDLTGFIPQRRRGRPLSPDPSSQTLYKRNLRAYLKKQAESPDENESETFHLSKRLDRKQDEMRRLYEKESWSLREIADHYKVTVGPIRTRLIKAGVKIREQKPRRRLLDRETLIQLYVDEKLPLSEIAGRLQTTYRKVCEELARHEIEKR